MIASTGFADDNQEPRLILPEGLVIAELVQDRMARQLERAPSDVAGIVAETGELPPGSSYRVEAEWRALDFPSDAYEPSANRVHGAVLVRSGVGADVRGDVVEVEGELLVDRGAHVHDTRRVTGALDVASERGRSPFPQRPLVVFVAGERDENLADWARELVNELVRRDVEGRLALPNVAAGMHLTRSCSPCEQSIRALAPDVVVALDAIAAAQVPSWCCADRSTVVIELLPELPVPAQLVSWHIGGASGRVRARISRHIDAQSLVDLAQRLCAGPHPMPPSASAEAHPKHEATTRDRIRGAESPQLPTALDVVLLGTPEVTASARAEGLVDHLSAAGVSVATELPSRRTPASARTAQLVLLLGAPDAAWIDELIAARADEGRVTVLDLDAADLVADSRSAHAAACLAPLAARLAEQCGLVTSPGGAVHHAARTLGVRAHVLPTLLTRARAAALTQAYRERASDRSTQIAVGWHVGSAISSIPEYSEAVAEGLAEILDERPDVQVHAIGEVGRLPAPLRGRDRVTTTAGECSEATLARWAVHLWVPALFDGAFADDTRDFIEASHAGVPSVLPAPSRPAIDGYVPPEVVISDFERPGAWASALRRLIDDEHERADRSLQAARRSHAVDGPIASQSIVNRFLGWTSHGASA
ncbi:MAG: hypothetical protein ACRDV7_14295 [Acidimicrobiia bacterium]